MRTWLRRYRRSQAFVACAALFASQNRQPATFRYSSQANVGHAPAHLAGPNATQATPRLRSVRSLPATFRHGSRSNVVDKLQRYASNVGACLSWMQTGLQRYTINRNERRAVALRSSVKRKSRTRALLSRRHFFRSAQEAT